MNFQVLGDSNQPLMNVVVSCQDQSLSAPYFQALTDSGGYVTIPNNFANNDIISAFVPGIHRGGAMRIKRVVDVLSPNFLKLEKLATGFYDPPMTRPMTGVVHWLYFPNPAVGAIAEILRPNGTVRETKVATLGGIIEFSLPDDPTGWSVRVTCSVGGASPSDTVQYQPVIFPMTPELVQSLSCAFLMYPTITMVVPWPGNLPTLIGSGSMIAPPIP